MFTRTSLLSSALTLPAFLLLIGCSSVSPVSNATANSVTAASGNWQISSTAPQAARLPSLSGSLTQTGTAISGILHADTSTACIPANMSIAVTGMTNAQSQVTLSGPTGDGGTLSVTGGLATDGKSLDNATYTVNRGTCAFASPAAAQAEFYANISGTYSGNFYDSDGQLIAITANLTQSPSSANDGTFQLSGTGMFPNNPCFNSPVPITNSQVTGGSFTFTYTDQQTLNSVVANGTFSTDGTTLNVGSWTLNGPCGPDTGYGLLTQP